VVDTNGLISAILKDGVPEAVITVLASHPDIVWIASLDIMDEYHGVLRRPKFALPPAILEHWWRFLTRWVTLVDVPVAVEFPRDPADAKFLACALAVDADYLITGDKDIQDTRSVGQTKIVSAATFHGLISKDGS
jgi:putative PIN family toxin of toxin-antitoxin system